MRIGADYIGAGRCGFSVWAPRLDCVELMLLAQGKRTLHMEKDAAGYWRAEAGDVRPGTPYLYLLDGKKERPDPASHYQPEGVHGPSRIIDHSFDWEDAGWRGVPLPEMIIYELHVGTFTPEGTFDAVIQRLPELAGLGVNAIELMPVSQFPGERNWGYDGAYPFAVQNSYGGPEGFKRLVNECHKAGVSVILDVVYNHFGPEGSYFRDYGPYFTGRYKTPWGDGINYDGPYSDGVRDFFIENGLFWLREYHMDALRIDAIHGIVDMSARPFLRELAERVKEFSEEAGRRLYLIAESDLNDPRAVRPPESGGLGFDAQWCDDFHHSLHTLLTGEKGGYYADFGKMGNLKKSIQEGFVYSGEYSVYRKKRHGAPSGDIPAGRFIVFSQNHDQVGNRMSGERLSCLVSFEAQKLAAGAALLSPYIPLLFMGEEYGESAPFLYFTSHSDAGLAEAVRKGRKEEFASFGLHPRRGSPWAGEPPDPQGVETFLRSKLKWDKRKDGRHRVLLDYYKELIRLRKETPALSHPDKECMEAQVSGDVMSLSRWERDSRVLCVFNFSGDDVGYPFPSQKGKWKKAMDSSDLRWDGPGSKLPEILVSGAELSLRGYVAAVFVKEALWQRA